MYADKHIWIYSFNLKKSGIQMIQPFRWLLVIQLSDPNKFSF